MEACLRSINSWGQIGPDWKLHVADDGSDDDLWLRFITEVHTHFNATSSRQHRRGLGASLNVGLAQAWADGLALYIQDDLLLEQSLDLNFPAAALNQCEDIAMIRIGLPHPDTTGRMRHIAGLHTRDSMVMELDPHHYVASHRPFMAHQRMSQLGKYIEGQTAEQTEREFNERYCSNPRLKIVQWIPSPWFHQHTVDLGTIQPRGE